MKKDREKYMKYLSSSIEEETQETNRIITELLKEKKISREIFDLALDNYSSDNEVLEVLNESLFEPSQGIVPSNAIAEEVIKFEIETLSKTKFPSTNYILEDEIFEKWGVEAGDVHSVCKSQKQLKALYQQASSLR